MARLKKSIGTPINIERIEKVKKAVVITEDTKVVADAWNGLSKKKRCTLKKNTLEIIQRNIQRGNFEDILTAIARYKELLADESYFFNYEWSLQDFTLQQ